MKIAEFRLPFELILREAIASDGVSKKIAGNSTIKFIYTDDQPNGNKQGIKQEEFASLIATSTAKPVKFGFEGGHSGAFPIGSILGMTQAENRLEGAGVLWDFEAGDVIDSLKKSIAENKNPQTSWEIFYEDSEKDNSGVEWLKGCITRAVTIVDNPAYQGRTPVVALAELQKGEKMTIEELTAANVKLTTDNEQLSSALASARTALEELVDLQKEVESLRSYKEGAEKEKADAALAEARFKKFGEAGLTVTREEFDAEKSKWLAMSEELFDFTLKLLKSKSSAEASQNVLPVTTTTQPNDPKAILREMLAERNKPQEKK